MTLVSMITLWGDSAVLTVCLIATVDTALPSSFDESVSASFDTSFCAPSRCTWPPLLVLILSRSY